MITLDKLMQHVNTTDDCWWWTGSRWKKSGYGRLGIAGKDHAAHRLMWSCTRGAIPDGMDVLHRCDHPACVRPEHLFLGTHQDNMRDMKEKGRARSGGPKSSGVNHYAAAFTATQVNEIRAASHLGCAALAARYGVSRPVMSKLLNRHTYRTSEDSP